MRNQFTPHKDVAPQRLLGRQRALLIHRLDAQLAGASDGQSLDLLSVERDLTAWVGMMVAGDDFDQRRLARAVVAEQAHDLVAPDVEVDVAQRLYFAERFAVQPST
ncbi:MAG TPA: hypothetical protein VGJ87_08295 [Roseiflexaceae bacterium]|jgi:hypothetical protein